MEALNLDSRPPTKQLPASEFPDHPADVYVCDKCGRDITAHLHRGRAHVRPPLGTTRFTCLCGQRYLSGATEWDYLSDWSKRQWLMDVGPAAILSATLALFSILIYFAALHHSTILFAFLAIALLFSLRLFPLFIAILAVPLEIIASLWRTRVMGNTHAE
jgi:hypothetical protein